VLDRSSVF